MAAQDISSGHIRQLAACLEKDVFNIELVARHLRQLLDHDHLKDASDSLSEDQIRIAGARYNRGTELSIDEIRQNTSYGDFVLKYWPRFVKLLR